jgi:hypothetical protein
MSEELSAARVPCGTALYEVVFTHGHRTLRRGDLVRMLEDPQYHNVLLRTDWTLHSLQGEDGDYVHLRLVSQTN